MLVDVLPLATSVYLLALSRSGRYVLALPLCAGLNAPYCAVVAVDALRQLDRTYYKKGCNNKGFEK